MKKIFKNLTNIFCLARCGWSIGWRCLLVVLRNKFGKISHPDMDRIVKEASIAVLKLTKTNYSVSSRFPFKFEKNTSYIFMSNHQSMIDIPLIYANVSGTVRFLVKKELLSVPLFGKMLKVSECIPVDRDKSCQETMFFQQIKDKLNKNIALWIFPEGTRSKTNTLLPFKSGGFRLAQQISAKIIPVGICNTRSVLEPKKLSLGFNQHTQINIGEPIDASQYEYKSLMEKVRAAILQLSAISK